MRLARAIPGPLRSRRLPLPASEVTGRPSFRRWRNRIRLRPADARKKRMRVRRSGFRCLRQSDPSRYAQHVLSIFGIGPRLVGKEAPHGSCPALVDLSARFLRAVQLFGRPSMWLGFRRRSKFCACLWGSAPMPRLFVARAGVSTCAVVILPRDCLPPLSRGRRFANNARSRVCRRASFSSVDAAPTVSPI